MGSEIPNSGKSKERAREIFEGNRRTKIKAFVYKFMQSCVSSHHGDQLKHTQRDTVVDKEKVMESQQQQQSSDININAAIPSTWGSGSNRIASMPTPPPPDSSAKQTTHHVQVFLSSILVFFLKAFQLYIWFLFFIF